MRRVRTRGFEILEEFKQVADEIASSMGLEDLIPQRGTHKSAGYDLRSIEEVVVHPNQVKIVGTGLTAYMQDDEELQVRPRSGSAKIGITVINAPGTIDSDYYGHHIGVMIWNTSDKDFSIKKGDRIAQGVFSKYLTADDDRPASFHRTGGFGSTGKS